ncbi:tRNA dimethylallyltransferase-like [Ceratina calcarata]|uniref:tRNA dimethylallyltransferase-like n=1 Tax=Ceratina calcarata TaxID=156304 RepID=A0AAJ7IZN0_9HYME|nr:tRNA dimethylallyltransferase-like [Ceratina calcarata]
MSRVPVLAILGSTGSGKSRLGIELARRFSGEIISADSMQVYKGLDIITAKVTKEEKAMVPHHMLDVVDPLNPSFTVVQFRDMAIPIIDDLLARRKMPIIVGGTNYYIESVLWKILIDKNEDEDDPVARSKRMKVEMDRFTTTSNEELFKQLTEVDPEMARRVHPNNRRKIIR